MKALVEEHKKFSLADMDIDEQQNETHKDLEMQLQSFDMSGVGETTFVYYNGISCMCQIKRQLGKKNISIWIMICQLISRLINL